MRKEIKKGIFLFCLVNIAVLLIINILLVTPNPLLKAETDNDWIGFFGGYLGALIGGLTTFSGVLLTIRYTKEQEAENNRLTVLPYISADYINNKINKQADSYISFGNTDEGMQQSEVCGNLILSNIGLGTAVNFSITDCKFDGKDINQSIFFDALTINQSKNLNISIRLPIEDSSQINEANSHLFVRNIPFTMNLKFNDFLNNMYEQPIELMISIGLIGKTNKYEFTISSYLNKISCATLKGKNVVVKEQNHKVKKQFSFNINISKVDDNEDKSCKQ